MRRLKMTMLVLGVLLTIVAMCATGASAMKANVVLREGGEHLYEGLDPVLAVGAPVEASVSISLGACSTTTPLIGEVHANDLSTDVLLFETEGNAQREEGSCSDESEGKKDSYKLALREVALSAKGKAKLRGSMTLLIYDPECDYEYGTFAKAKATFQVPSPGKAGEAIVKATAKSENHPPKTCPKKAEASFTITLADNGGYPLETTLEG